MLFRIILEQLLAKRDRLLESSVPDGLIDLSGFASPLATITASGRPMRSSDPGEIARLLADFARSYLSDEANDDDVYRHVLGLYALLTLVLREIPVIRPDLSLEEFLADVLTQERVADVERTLRGMPYRLGPDGQQVVDISTLPLFFEGIPLTEEAKRGFRERKVEPHRPKEQWEPGDDEKSGTEQISTTETGLTFEIISASEVVGTADALDGFDEFYDEAPDDDDNDDW